MVGAGGSGSGWNTSFGTIPNWVRSAVKGSAWASVVGDRRMGRSFGCVVMTLKSDHGTVAGLRFAGSYTTAAFNVIHPTGGGSFIEIKT
jgi:hypothetical protein